MSEGRTGPSYREASFLKIVKGQYHPVLGLFLHVQSSKLGSFIVFFYIILLFVLLLSEYDEYPFPSSTRSKKRGGIDGEKGEGEDKTIPCFYFQPVFRVRT